MSRTLDADPLAALAQLRRMARTCKSEAEARAITERIATLSRYIRTEHGIGLPASPAAQAAELDPGYVIRPHTQAIDDAIVENVEAVEQGESRMLMVSTPPRVGKSTLLSLYLPLWILRRHPDWPVVLISHGGGLATTWGRQIRRTIEKHPGLRLGLQRDSGAASEWETTAGGGVLSRSVRGSLTGRGAKVMVIDDPVKDYAEAHSITMREAVWDWWLSVALTRLEPPSLVIVVMTRWHEDDFVGRLLSPEHEGDPDEWRTLRLPALAEGDEDPLGRKPGEPLLSPLIPDETPEEAVARWRKIERNVGSYTWASLYQQRPAPDSGAIFDTSWWRFWTSDPEVAEANEDVLLVKRDEVGAMETLTAWDAAFKAEDSGSYVVGQTWAVQKQAREERYLLVEQDRARRTFTETIRAIKAMDARWPSTSRILIEDKANGPAIIDTLRKRIPKVRGWPASASKVERARAVTPLIEDGRVFLPHPSEAPWVSDLINECRDFPHATHDDQVDAMAHALAALSSGRRKVPMAVPIEIGRTPPWQMT